MKKALSMILTLAMLLILAACGSAPAQTGTDTQGPAAEEEASAAEELAPAMEEPTEEATNTVKVTFDYNYDGAPESLVIEVEADGVISPHNEENPNSAPETPTRDGYRFAGWDTEKEPVLENGYSTTMWSLDDYYMIYFAELGPAMGVEEERMPLTEDITLYARWVEKTVINTPEELLAMREDLSGWYVLGSDIDLSGTDWIPVGNYVSHYEYLNPTWWKEAFRGELDGAGHTITGLTLNTVAFFDDNNSTRKGIRNGVAAMFAATADGASIHDLTLDAPVIDIQSDIHYAYIAPLAGMVEGCDFVNCHVTNMSFKAVVSDAANEQEAGTTGIYTSLSGMVCGMWVGSMDNCTCQGSMDVELTSTLSHSGSVFVGGILGDGYNALNNCSSELAIRCVYQDVVVDSFEMAEDMSNAINIMVGGTAGLSAALIMCPSSGNIQIVNESEAGNAIVLCEGSCGMILGGPDAVVASDYTGTIEK